MESRETDLFDEWWASHSSAPHAEGPWPLSRDDIREVFEVGASAQLDLLLRGIADDNKKED